MKCLTFNQNDLMLLQNLGEYHLYLLNVALVEAATIAKANWPSRVETYAAVSLAETAAKEVACRNRWSPALATDEKYSVSGVTYDIPEYRDWLNSCRKDLNKNLSSGAFHAVETFELLEQFSFADTIFEIKRTA